MIDSHRQQHSSSQPKTCHRLLKTPKPVSLPQKSNHQRCLGGFFSFCQFFIVLHKIRHECIMTLHERFTKTTKKTKHGNVYNGRSTLKNAKNGNQKHGFLTIFLYNFVNSLLCCIKNLAVSHNEVTSTCSQNY